jgi:hypothetical protein
VASFAQCLETSLRFRHISPEKEQNYVTKLKELGSGIDPLKSDIDLLDFVAPISNLLEPGMAEGALNALDHFIGDKLELSISFLYQRLNEECLLDLQSQ